jgi:hypothetical protein
MIRKITLILIVLLLATSIVYASNIGDLKVPSDFSGQREDGNYFMPKTYDNPRFIIAEFNESDNPFKNSTVYESWPSSEKNISFFSNKHVSDLGAVELIQIDGKKYTVSVLYATTVKDEDYMHDAVDYILEFNKLNNITSIEP